MSMIGTATVLRPLTPNVSMTSDDDDHHNLTPIFGNPAQYMSPNPQRCHHPVQLCQKLQATPDTLKCPPRKNKVQGTISVPMTYLARRQAHIKTVVSSEADGLQNLTLHTHLENNESVTGYLVFGKSYEQVIEETFADFLHQTAQPGESAQNRQLKRNPSIAGLQSGVFTFTPRGVSQAATCDGLFNTVNFNSQKLDVEENSLHLFEDQN